MTKITYIPGEIANAAIDEHGNRKPVTRTQHIFDDTKSKSQAEVNADIDDTLALHQSEINALNSQNYVTVDSFNALPATGAADTVYRVSNWDGTQQDPTVYSEYAWNGSQYVHLSTKTQIGEVFDISAYHATGGTLATYADLSAALDSNNGGGVPQSLQKGGMSVKYVCTYDNKYVQCHCMAQNFTTDITLWAIADESIYIENPEWIYVLLDAKKRILAGIKSNGSIEWSIGVPTPVKTYIANAIAEIKNGTEGTDLDGLNKIIAFLSEFSTSDTLKNLLDSKVDKEEGKSLIPTQYIQEVENPEFIHVETDNAGRILGGRKADGSKFETVGFETPSISVGGQVTKHYTDKEGRIELNIDSKGRIISYRDKDGVLHEVGGLFANGINIPDSIKEIQEKILSSPEIQSPRFIQISDPHNDNRQTVENGVNAEGRMTLLANMIDDENKNGNLDFVICTGDCCLPVTHASGERDNYLSLFKERVIDKVPTIFLPVVGNHDAYTDEEWYNCFKMPKQYSATVGQCYLIVLNVYRDSIEWNYRPSHPNADEKGYVPCSILDAEGVAHGRDFRFTTVDTDFLEEQLKIATKLGKTPIVCYHTFETRSAVDETAAAASVATARSLINNYDCKLILYGHSHITRNVKVDNQWQCNPGWFGPINDYTYNVSPWAINLFENKNNYFSVTSVVLEHDYPDSNPEYHHLPGGAIGHIDGSRTTINLWESNDKRSMFNF